jgi:hypothetical protein
MGGYLKMDVRELTAFNLLTGLGLMAGCSEYVNETLVSIKVVNILIG